MEHEHQNFLLMEMECLICMQPYCGLLVIFQVLEPYMDGTLTRLACPRCNFDTTPNKLLKGGKFCFMSYRRWLYGRHRVRQAQMRCDGTIENRNPHVVVLVMSPSLKE